MFYFNMENKKENQMEIKLFRNLHIFKLINLYTCKNIIIIIYFFSSFLFFFFSLSLHFPSLDVTLTLTWQWERKKLKCIKTCFLVLGFFKSR